MQPVIPASLDPSLKAAFAEKMNKLDNRLSVRATKKG
jgi:hypothetical protein